VRSYVPDVLNIVHMYIGVNSLSILGDYFHDDVYQNTTTV
jgi:hypothetical protein